MLLPVARPQVQDYQHKQHRITDRASLSAAQATLLVADMQSRPTSLLPRLRTRNLAVFQWFLHSIGVRPVLCNTLLHLILGVL